jgi:PAS domain-containing protein
MVNQEQGQECEERLRLVDAYSRAVTDFNAILEDLRPGRPLPGPGTWSAAEISRQRSEQAWQALEAHIAEHGCLDLHWSDASTATSANRGDVLQAAAMAALDIILVTDDQRQFVDMNEAAAKAFKLPRNEAIGRKVDDFFTGTRGETVMEAYAAFLADGVQSGVCVLVSAGAPRRFEYRAQANFAPGLHLGVLREIKD